MLQRIAPYADVMYSLLLEYRLQKNYHARVEFGSALLLFTRPTRLVCNVSSPVGPGSVDDKIEAGREARKQI